MYRPLDFANPGRPIHVGVILLGGRSSHSHRHQHLFHEAHARFHHASRIRESIYRF
ncbi:hypothetical protein J3F84DRAFT_374860 [Trichoderma pleuroticola]